MTPRTRHTAAVGLLLAAGALAVLAGSARAATLSPLPQSDYTAQAVCPPATAQRATCLALRLLPASSEARSYTHPLGVARASTRTSAPSPTSGLLGLRPSDLHAAYSLPSTVTSAQTIALVDAFNDLTIEADLRTYDKDFDLPECTTANGCLQKVNEHGESGNPPFPQNELELDAAETTCTTGKVGELAREEACYFAKEAIGWTVETSLDVETAHAICQNCRIALVEAASPEYEDLDAAEDTAAETLGASEISNSWGGPECGPSEQGFTCASDTAAFNHPGVVITAAAGDYGYLDWDSTDQQQGYADFPASSPDVVAVGGTRLGLEADTSAWKEETVWNGDGAGGGGCSVLFEAQPWQQDVTNWPNVGCGDKRAVSDVSADADPYTGLAVRDSTAGACETAYIEGGREKKLADWCTIGGTSLASPIIASTFALAGGAHATPYPAATLYASVTRSPGSLHDVVAGSNGRCGEGFESTSGLSRCSLATEAAACTKHLICVACAGYDGPSGLGSPDGLGAFEPATGDGGGTEATCTEPTGEQESEGEQSSAIATTPVSQPSSGPPVLTVTPVKTTSGSGGGQTSSAGATVELSALALTHTALVALNRSRPPISQIGFAFTINVAEHVRVTLRQRVRKHGRTLWQALGKTITLSAKSGRNSGRLGGRATLKAGAYRLTLTPLHGAADTLPFTVG